MHGARPPVGGPAGDPILTAPRGAPAPRESRSAGAKRRRGRRSVAVDPADQCLVDGALRLVDPAWMRTDGLEIERKYLLAGAPTPAELTALGSRPIRMEQRYLRGTAGSPVRRIRRSESNGSVVYTYTEKRNVGGIVREERERAVDAATYDRLLLEVDPDLRPIRKTRHVFEFGGHMLELDVFDEPPGLVLLEIELERADEPEPERPPLLRVIRDVSEEWAYFNVNLARVREDGVPYPVPAGPQDRG